MVEAVGAGLTRIKDHDRSLIPHIFLQMTQFYLCRQMNEKSHHIHTPHHLYLLQDLAWLHPFSLRTASNKHGGGGLSVVM